MDVMTSEPHCESAPGLSLRIVVPWRGGDPHRETLWARCSAELDPELVVLGRSPDGPFNRAAAINDGARGEWDVLVVMDADVLIDQEQLNSAVRRSHATQRVVLAFDSYCGFTARNTRLYLQGQLTDLERGSAVRRDDHESSCVAIPRAAWEAVGGFDERFIGWGQEDVAFIHAVRVLHGPIERVPGTVYHLWHPASRERRPTPAYYANQERGQRYRATHDPAAMRALLAEG